MTNVNKTKAFAYYRTSSAANVGTDKDTRARQETAVQSYAYANGIDIVESFYDAAVSGADAIDTRPGFRALLEAIAANGVRTILVETANRFARDLITQETGWRFLQSQGIDLIAIDSPNAFLDDTPTAVLIRQILGAVAQFEKAALVARLSGARRRLHRHGGKPALRFTRPELSVRVRSLRLAYPDASLRELGSRLASEGFVTPSGKPYGPSGLARLLSTCCE